MAGDKIKPSTGTRPNNIRYICGQPPNICNHHEWQFNRKLQVLVIRNLCNVSMCLSIYLPICTYICMCVYAPISRSACMYACMQLHVTANNVMDVMWCELTQYTRIVHVTYLSIHVKTSMLHIWQHHCFNCYKVSTIESLAPSMQLRGRLAVATSSKDHQCTT